MKCLPLFCATMALTLTFSPGCKKQDEDNVAAPKNVMGPQGDPNEVVASVDGVQYLRKDLETRMNTELTARNIPEDQLEQAREFFEQQIITEFVKKTLLLNEANKEGIVVTPEDRAEMIARIEPMLAARNMTLDQYFQSVPLGEEFARSEFEKGLIFDKLLKEKVLNHIVVDDAAVAAMMAELDQANTKAEESKKTKLAKIEDIKKQLDGGADFAALAKEHSDCPSKEKGGDLGTFARGQMVPEFENAAFTQEVGKVGGIVETQFGYHLIKVTAKNPAVAAAGNNPETPETVAASHILAGFGQEGQVRPLPSADEIRTHLKDQRARLAAQEYLAALQAKAKIESIVPIDAE